MSSETVREWAKLHTVELVLQQETAFDNEDLGPVQRSATAGCFSGRHVRRIAVLMRRDGRKYMMREGKKFSSWTKSRRTRSSASFAGEEYAKFGLARKHLIDSCTTCRRFVRNQGETNSGQQCGGRRQLRRGERSGAEGALENDGWRLDSAKSAFDGNGHNDRAKSALESIEKTTPVRVCFLTHPTRELPKDRPSSLLVFLWLVLTFTR